MTSNEPTPPKKRPIGRRVLAWTLAGLAAGLVLAAGLIGVGAQREGSLACALRWAVHWVPLDEQGSPRVQWDDVSGALWGSGQIGRLSWRSADGRQIAVQGLRWTLEPGAAWALAVERRWSMAALSVQDLSLRWGAQGPAPNPDAPAPLTMPRDLRWPWLREVRLPLTVQRLSWGEGPASAVGPLSLRYRYHAGVGHPGKGEASTATANAASASPSDGPVDDQTLARIGGHVLHVDRASWHGIQARGHAGWGHQSPFPLRVTLEAVVSSEELAQAASARHPPKLRTTRLDAQAVLEGALGGDGPSLALQLRVKPAGEVEGTTVDLHARWQPRAAQPLSALRLDVARLNLAAWWPGAPQTLLSGAWRLDSDLPASSVRPGEPSSMAAQLRGPWRLSGEWRNARPGPWDQGQLPLTAVRAALQGSASSEDWVLERLEAQVAGGQMRAQGRWRTGSRTHRSADHGIAWPFEGHLQARGLQPSRWWSTWRVSPVDLDASIDAAGEPGWQLRLAPASGAGASEAAGGLPLRLDARGRLQPEALWVETLRLEGFGAVVQAQARVPRHVQATGGRLQLSLPGAELELRRDEGSPWRARLAATDLQRLQVWVDTAVVQVQSFSRSMGLSAPWIEALSVVRGGPRLQGGLQVEADGSAPVTGGPWWRDGAVWLQARSLAVTLPAPAVAAPGSPGGARPPSGGLHRTWTVDGALRLRASAGAVRLSMEGLSALGHGWPYGWAVHSPSALVLKPGPAMAWTLEPGTLRIEPRSLPNRAAGAMPVKAALLEWDTLAWRDQRLVGRGRIAPLGLGWIDAWSRDPMGLLGGAQIRGDVELEGQWSVDWSWGATRDSTRDPTPQPTRLDLALRHRSGDLVYAPPGAASQALELQSVQARLQVRHPGDLTLEAAVRTARLGHVEAQAQVRGQGQTDGSPSLDGRWSLSLPEIGMLGSWTPPGWRVGGRAQGEGRFGGTWAAPQWQGRLAFEGLQVRSVLDGIDLREGRLVLRAESDRLEIEALRLLGGAADGGLVTGTGQATWAPDASGRRRPRVDLSLELQALRLLARADRRLSVSGAVQTRWAEGLADAQGRLRVDQALLEWADESTPRLGADVVVRGQAAEAPPQDLLERAPLRLSLDVDLGPAFQVRGQGLQSRLEGQLALRARPGAALQVLGDVRTRQGEYRAYGQRLKIEEGALRFNGPPDNPQIELLALRPMAAQRVGVQVRGSAQQPLVRLFADPEMPDAEKLAWLVLGRPLSGAGAQAAVLQQAALALVTGGRDRLGGLEQRLGLDEISLQGETATADGGARPTTLSLGKRLSDQLYVSFARSLTGTVGTVAVFLDLSRRLSLRAQAGDANAVDLVFRQRKD